MTSLCGTIFQQTKAHEEFRGDSSIQRRLTLRQAAIAELEMSLLLAMYTSTSLSGFEY